ncbi:creatininase family protein [Paenibacillaceae bacterium WGS1546]|uniref:creatininase family protein n=1 Tax=Cohnella sp. WGS1546 TaxID=3366810 RepID=UPI00372CF9D2
MTRNSGSNGKPRTAKWSELLPWEFKRRQAECPIVYLPLGICEPHGQVAAFGLDTIKAEWLCEEAALRAGGIVAPSMGYHIHESGYHANWLEETVGDNNPHMTGMPPHAYLRFFLYQLRAFANAGFRGIVVVSGHSGGNQFDLRMAADLFGLRTGIRTSVSSDPELVEGRFVGDHAGKYELSQLLYLRPDLVDLSKKELAELAGSGGTLAIGHDSDEATAELGEAIMQACLQRIEDISGAMASHIRGATDATEPKPLDYAAIEEMWEELWERRMEWQTMKPWSGQTPVTLHSRWRPYERPNFNV